MSVVSAAQIETYRKDGFLNYGPILDREELSTVRDYIDQLIASLPAWQRPEHLDMSHVGDEFLLKLCSHKRILDLIERFIGPNIVLFASHLIAKPRGDGMAVPWHQDAEFWPLKPMNVITLWLAIDDSTVENGCMRVILGSHLRDAIGHESAQGERNVLRLQINPADYDESQAVDVVLKAGECSLHDPFLIHGSNPNTSDKRRCGYTMRFMPVETRLDRSKSPNHPLYLLRGTDALGNNPYANA